MGQRFVLQANNNLTVANNFNIQNETGNTDVSLKLQAGNDININASVIASGAGFLNLSANDNGGGTASGLGAVKIGAAGSLVTANQNITITAHDFNLTAGGTINAGTGNIFIKPTADVTTMNVGTANGAPFVVDDAEISAISTSGTITIGDRSLSIPMLVQGVGAIVGNRTKNINLATASTIDGDATFDAAVSLTSGTLTLDAGDKIGSINPPLTLSVSKLSLKPASDFNINDGTALSDLSVITAGTAGNQTLTLPAGQTYTVAENSPAKQTTITTVSSSTPLNFSYENDASDILVGNGVGGGISAGGGNVALLATAGAVTEQSGAAILANGLAVTAKNSSSLAQSGNDVTTVAANITGAGQSFSYEDATGVQVDAVTVGANPAVTGITTAGGAGSDVLVKADTGDLILNQNINANGGNVGLTATTGAVTENNGVKVLGAGLAVTAQKSSSLARSGNDVTTVAANITGAGQSFSYEDATGVQVDAVTVGASPTVTGITTAGGDVGVTTLAGDLALNQNVSAGAGNVSLTAAGDITQLSPSWLITGGSVALKGGSAIGPLAQPINTATTELTIETGAGGFDVNNTGTLTDLGVISDDGMAIMEELVSTGLPAPNFVITQAGGNTTIKNVVQTGLNFSYQNKAGGISIGDGVSGGINVGSGGDNVALTAAGAIVETTGSIQAGALVVKTEKTGGANITLNQAANNHVSSVDLESLNTAGAATDAGTISYQDSGGFDVVALKTTAGANLTGGGAITENSGTIAAGALVVKTEKTGGANITLNQAANNHVSSVDLESLNTAGAATDAGTISYQDSGGFDVVALKTTAGANLTGGGAITENSGTIAAGALVVKTEKTGGANITLNQAANNHVSSVDLESLNTAGAATDAGTISYQDSGGFDVVALKTTAGANLTGGGAITENSGTIAAGALVVKTEKTGGANITLNQAANNHVSSVDLESLNTAGAATDAGTISYQDSGGFDVVALKTTAGANLTGGGAITENSGTIAAGALVVKTEKTGGANITLNQAANNHVSSVDLESLNTAGAATDAGTISYQDSGGFDVVALKTTAGANLTGGGAITENSGTIAAGALVVKTEKTGGANITLNQAANNHVSSVDLESLNTAGAATDAGTISYQDSGGFDVVALKTTAGANLTGGGAITENSGTIAAGALVVKTEKTGGANITLNQAANNHVSSVDLESLNTAGAATDAGTISYQDSGGFDVVALKTTAGANLTGGGAITENSGTIAAGALVVKTEKTGGANITLNQAANNHVSSVDLESLNTAGAATDAGTISYQDSGGFDVVALKTTAGANLTGGGAITENSGTIAAGALVVKTEKTGGANITLNQAANNHVSSVDLESLNTAGAATDAGTISYQDSGGFDVVALKTTAGANLTGGGAITENSGTIAAGALVVKTEKTGGANITLNQAANNHVSSVDLESLNTAGAATDAGTISYQDSGGFDVVALKTTAGANLTGGGAITENSGTIAAGALVVKTEKTGGANITLNQAANNHVSSVDLESLNTAGAATDAGTISYQDSGGFDVVALKTTAGANLTGGGAITENSGTIAAGALVVKTEKTGGANITLNQAANNHVSSVDLESLNTAGAATDAGTISYQDSGGFDVVALKTTAGANLTGGGAITENSGTIAAGALVVKTEKTGGANITLNQAANNHVSSVDLESLNTAGAATDAGTISYQDSGGFDVVALKTTAGANLTGGGAITENSGTIAAGALVVKTEKTGGANITLNQAANNHVSSVDLESLNTAGAATDAGTISYQDSGGFDVVALKTTGNATLGSGAGVTQSGAILAAGLELLGAGPFTLNLASGGNAVNQVTTLAGNTTGGINFRNQNGLTVDTVNSTGLAASGGDVVLVADAGDLVLNKDVTASGGNATLTATAGNIVNGGGKVSGNLVALTAGAANGAVAANTRATSLALTGNGTGTITVTEDDGATINSATTGSGAIQVTSTTGDLSIGGPVTTTGNATLTATAGNIVNGGGKVSGNLVALTAGAANGAVAANTRATSLALTGNGTGTITVTEDDGATINSATTGSGAIQVTSTTGDLSIGGPVTTTGNATLTATAGNIVNGGGKVSGNLVALTAGAANGAVAANTRATSLALTGNGTGTITVTEDDGATINSATTGSGAIQVTSTTGDLSIGGPVTTTGNATLTATAGNIVNGGGKVSGNLVALTAGAANGAVAANTRATSLALTGNGTGTITVTEDDGATINSATTGSGAIQVTSTTGDLSIGGPVTTTGNATLTATAGNIVNGGGKVSGNLVALTAGAANGAVAANTRATSLALTGNGTGTITVTEDDGATINSATTGSGAIQVTSTTGDLSIGGPVTTTGNATLTATAGNIVNGGGKVSGNLVALTAGAANGAVAANTRATSLALTGNGTGTITVTEDDGATINSATTGSGAIQVTSTTGDLSIGGPVTTTGNATLTATAGNIVNGGGKVSGNLVALTAGAANGAVAANTRATSLALTGNGTGTITVTEDDGATINSATTGSGAIQVTSTTGDLSIGGPVTTTGNATLTATAGNIVNGGGKVSGNLVALTAGAANGAVAANTRATSLALTGNGTGTITVTEDDGATINSATTGSGAIQVTSTTGDLSIGGPVTTTGNATLTATAGNIVNGGGKVSGNLVALTAGAANGAVAANTRATSLALTGNGTGTITVTEDDGATINSATTGSGAIQVTSTTGDLSIGGPVTTTGNATLTATAGNIVNGGGKVSGNLVALTAGAANGAVAANTGRRVWR